ncbi:hypothetical protein OROHE_021587 [Orobanche hederae]
MAPAMCAVKHSDFAAEGVVRATCAATLYPELCISTVSEAAMLKSTCATAYYPENMHFHHSGSHRQQKRRANGRPQLHNHRRGTKLLHDQENCQPQQFADRPPGESTRGLPGNGRLHPGRTLGHLSDIERLLIGRP